MPGCRAVTVLHVTPRKFNEIRLVKLSQHCLERKNGRCRDGEFAQTKPDLRRIRVPKTWYITSDTLQNIVLEAIDNAFVKGQTF